MGHEGEVTGKLAFVCSCFSVSLVVIESRPLPNLRKHLHPLTNHAQYLRFDGVYELGSAK
jgi:hypothetical protein